MPRIEDAFARVAMRQPSRIALSCPEQSLSYERLWASVESLSACLKLHGAGPGTIVALQFPPSAEFVLALLAILSTGAAYTPLEPSDPPARIRQHLEALRPVLVLTGSDREGETTEALQRITVDSFVWHVHTPSFADYRTTLLDSEVACIMATSGSHGEPKHVLVTHRGILNLALNKVFDFVDPNDVFLFHSPPSFDASTFEIWGCLLRGATLVISPNQRFSLKEFADIVKAGKVTTLWLPAALFAAMVEFEISSLRGLRTLIAGGDVVSARHIREAFVALPGVRLINGYGPTECTTFTCCFVMTEAYLCALSIPIGRPVSNVTVAVCDEQCRPVAQGEVGELLVAGAGLAIGYLNQPELTRTAFLYLHSHGGALERFYKTGDIVRRLPDGNLEFRGRADNQIKLRGFRIEPEEIEKVIDSYPQIAKSAVCARTTREGDKMLVATLALNTASTHGAKSVTGFYDQYVAQWQTVYDARIYRDLAQNEKLYGEDFNITGWIDSYTGEPLTVEEMKVQVDETCRRILSSGPRRILEVGCGSGLLMHRLIDECESYVGIDSSINAVDFVKQSLARSNSSGVRRSDIRHWPAHRISELGVAYFDCIVLNSVTQHFPDVEYLLVVLRQCADIARPGGMIFVGDVRCLPLHRAFHTSVQLTRSSPDLECERLRDIIDLKIAREQELLIDPMFFRGDLMRRSGIGASSIYLKRGRRHNELTRFRYDALLYLEPAPTGQPCREVQYDKLGHRELPAIMADLGKEPTLLRDIPNQRIARDLATMRLLDSSDVPPTVRQLQPMSNKAEVQGIDPEDIFAIGDSLDQSVCIKWPMSNLPDCFDAELNVATQSCADPISIEQTPNGIETFANKPGMRSLRDHAENGLRAYLKERLPPYMIPSRFVWRDDLPVDSRGKLNRPALTKTDSTTTRPVLAPAGIEGLVAEIWTEELNERMTDNEANFFELGGDSLNAVRVAAKLGRLLGVNLPAHVIFENLTIRKLSFEILRRVEEQNQSQLQDASR